MCGSVIISSVKNHIVLKALSSMQVYREDLKVYAKIILSERVKPRIQERLPRGDCSVKEKVTIT